MARGEPARWRRPLTATLLVLVPLAVFEGLLHGVPGLLPLAYRETWPAHGVELFRPGVLSETPIEGLPVPLVPTPWDGAPPADLKELGIAPADDRRDGDRFGRVHIPSDARGLPNVRALDRARTLLVGDSFVVSASYLERPGLPLGLVDGLEEAGAGPVYSLGVSGIGPLRQGWLLERVGLPLEPELVLWFFFGGNDLSDAKTVLERRAAGLRVHADLPSYRPPPRLRSLDLLRWWAIGAGSAPSGGPREAGPLPPVTWRGEAAGAEPRETWLHPSHMARACLPPAAWDQHVAWDAARTALREARDACRRSAARLVVVYLPSKVEALAGRLDPDEALLRRHLVHGIEDDLGERQWLPALRANRGALAGRLGALCSDEGIAFLSATPALEALARSGESGFLVTDTHWSPLGVEAVLSPLVEFLRAQGLLAP